MGFELGTDGPGAIVVGVDGSPTSLRAAAYAAGLARRQCTRLVAVYARTSPAPLLTLLDRSGVGVKAVLDSQDEIEAQLRDGLARQVRDWQLDAALVVRTGEPLAVLSRVAADVRAEAVIVGSSASVGHRIAGSLAVRLVRCARWPVTVVP
ncbi:universal stress protein [Couchioplanes caeruleus]|uniref:universal stress protein n=1 Tax=Couchioplanes caeruleus TaxID=56438 RepID=UPI0020BDD9D1|nr:universal stress protein [Couchioplanes caeruleus]UQU65365.1 universal stress protein [Couchioplanes caeruleus]